MSNMTVGTCSICGGRVSVPMVWHGIIPPTPTCENCGAVAAQHGPVIPMQPATPVRITYSGNTTPTIEDFAKTSADVPKGKSLLVD